MDKEAFDVNTATVQEAMDYAVQQMVAQGGRCLSRTGSCLYDDGKGKHCAVGWLIPEGGEQLSGGVHSICIDYPELVPALVKENQKVFSYLQGFHDHGNAACRRHYLRNLAAHGIDTSAPHWQQWVNMGEGE